MPGTCWFRHVVKGASYPSEGLVLEAIERVLDAANPAKVDPEASSALDGSLTIAHTLDNTADIYIEVHEERANLEIMITQREIRATDLETDRIKATTRAVAQIIQSLYIVERTRWHSKIIRTTVSTQDQPGRRHQTATGSRSPIRLLDHERIDLDYDCNPLAPPWPQAHQT